MKETEKIEKLNEAMKVLKEECARHRQCEQCPLTYKANPMFFCRLSTEPEHYKLFEVADQ